MSKKRRKNKKQSRKVEALADVSLPAPQVYEPPQAGDIKDRRLLWIIPALILINLVIYAQARHFNFTHWDDPAYVSKNVEVSHGLTWHGFRWAFTTVHEANWHPLTWLSHMLDVQIFGMASGPHHLVNVFFHIANTLLLFWILFRMTAAAGRSAFVAGLFAAHPLHVESVAWVAERKDVLSAFFFFLTIAAYVEYVRRPDIYRRLLVGVLFAFALMAKPMAITLPIILFLLDIWPLNRLRFGTDHSKMVGMRLVREKAPLLILAAASGAATLWAQWHGGTVVKIDAYPLTSRIGNALISYVAYIRDMFWPSGLSAFYPYSAQNALWIAACFFALAGMAFFAFRSFQRRPFVLVGWMWYLTTLVPVIGFIQVGAQARADRYAYLPLIGMFILIAWGIAEVLGRLPNSKIPIIASAVVVLGALTWTAHIQARCWTDGVALWEHALKAFPNSHLAHLNEGYELNERGETDKAVQHYEEALRLNPRFAEAHNALGVALAKKGRQKEAKEHFDQALRLKPDYSDARSNVGAASQGKTDQALANLAAAAKLNPDNAEVQFNLGMALVQKGKGVEAMPYLSEALRLKPEFVEARDWMGNAYTVQGKMEEAIVQFKEALRINPDFAEAHNDWGIALASQSKYKEAVDHYKEALRIKPDMAEAHNGLGNVYFYTNRLAEATAEFKEAIRIAPAAGTHRNLGMLFAQQGKMNEAIAQYRQALRLDPEMLEARSSLGKALLMTGKVDEAIPELKHIILANPNYAEAHFDLGVAYMTKSAYDDAIASFNEALRLTPDNFRVHAYLGLALVNKGRDEEAIPHLKEVLRVSPDDPIARDALKTAQTRLQKKSKR
jgi:protein O-mannosyl-transferase